MAIDSKQKIKIVLEKMLDEHLLGAESDNCVKIKIDQFLVGEPIDKDEFVKIMRNLDEKRIINKAEFYKINNNEKIWYPLDKSHLDWNQCHVYVHTEPINFRSLAREHIKHLSDAELETKTTSGLILYLDGTGNFWHGDKNEFCYPMGATKDRLLIIKYLVENKGLQATELIASALGKDKQNIRTEVSKIRKNIKKYLKLEDVIQSKKDSGYQLNSKYEVILR